MTFEKILKDIKLLKVQGAEHVAVAAGEAIILLSKENKNTSNSILKKKLLQGKKQLFAARPTEPMMRNLLMSLLSNLPQNNQELHQLLNKKQQHFHTSLKQSQEIIAKLITKKIANNALVYTHCHSSTVTQGLIFAKQQKKKFVVWNTETRPVFQGRITAKELAKAKIPVMHVVDAAMRLVLKKADIIFLGADAITTTKVYNKIGSEIAAEYAERYQIPLYICTHSLKFDPQYTLDDAEPIEQRNWKEVWPNKPKNVTIINPAFEAINPQLITGIISEHGILTHGEFVSLMIKKIKKTKS